MNCKIKFTLDQVEQAMGNYEGFCLACGESQCSCEPDAQNYECESCGEMEVFGAEEILIMGLVEE
jgi:hypothetical protein